MENVILGLGSYVKILPKISWEQMGRPQLIWSPVQLFSANQYKIYPIGRLKYVHINLDGVEIIVDFEVIEIVDETETYPALLVIN